ncbi:MAG: 2-C-methyl-D-erythritol 4-phosphate cytidylyltransferase [Acidobacteria bacterium]|nr:2-C-methyl-D-erythritol 4-phosphate cytidylyltransferase [Acidobacteriota bacterium]
MKASVIVAAAGRGRRFGGPVPKQYLPLAGEPLLGHCLRRFDAHPGVEGIVVVVDSEAEFVRHLGSSHPFAKIRAVVPGGPHRQDSVRRGLERVPDQGVVLVHDAARPLVPAQVIAAVLEAAGSRGAAVPVLPVPDTPKLLDSAGGLERTLDRSRLVLAQTPQGFAAGLLRRGLQAAERDGFLGTDDAWLVERLGVEVTLVPGAAENLKVTTPGDLRRAGELLAGMASAARLRTGFGFDQHPLESGRRLVLGGVEVPFSRGLEGHSDADVLTHAACDALLGAAGLDDLGARFPDSDPRYLGARSLDLLADVARMVAAAGFRMVNLDATVVAEEPALAPFRSAMRTNLAGVLGCPEGAVSVKASRSGGLGPVGRGEGMAAWCVVLVEEVG